jgi:hypothetical protein
VLSDGIARTPFKNKKKKKKNEKRKIADPN